MTDLSLIGLTELHAKWAAQNLVVKREGEAYEQLLKEYEKSNIFKRMFYTKKIYAALNIWLDEVNYRAELSEELIRRMEIQ